MKNQSKIIFLIVAGLFFCSVVANASETTGTLSTGLETGLNGTVVVAPTANVASGTYTSEQNISLAATGSLSIHYTTNSETPACATGNVYSGPITISSTTTLKAIACYANSVSSNVSTFDYVINLATAPLTPTANPVAGTYTSAQSVALASVDSTSIRYTTDGTDPTCSTGNLYSAVIAIDSTQTIKAIGCSSVGSSSVASFVYTINIPTGGGGGGGGGGSAPATYNIGDINKDNKVDKYDFSLMMANWGKSGTNVSDLNKDGKVDKYDFALLMLHWGGK